MKQIAMALILMVSVLQGATIRVPQDQPTIQAGINAAVDGDTVLVGPGVYSENLLISNKRVAIVSRGGADSTIISAANSSVSTAKFENCLPRGAVLEGFSVTGSSHTGISCVNSSVAIMMCKVYDNTSGSHNDAGGIDLKSTSGCLILGNEIYNNSNTCCYGPAIHIGDNGASSTDDTVAFNQIYGNVGYGDIRILGPNTGTKIFNNTIVVSTYAGLYHQGTGSVDVRNNIIVDAPSFGIRNASSGTVLAEYNCLYNNGQDFLNVSVGSGNIYQDPLFLNQVDHDLRLQQGSPCINAGDPNPIYNDPDGGRNDMGAFPFISPDTRREVPQEYPTIQAAIDAAVDGDTVLVNDGHYYERISFLGKKIIVTSKYLIDSDTLHIYQTIIDGDTAFVPLVGDTGSVVRFVNDEDSTSILEGFTIQNGIGTGGEGGGIYCEWASPKLKFNHIANNGSSSAVRLRDGLGAILESCWVYENSGSGVRCINDGLYESRNSSFVANSGHGILCTNWALIRSIYGGTISFNQGDGIDLRWGGIQFIHDCLIEGNTGWGISMSINKSSPTTGLDTKSPTAQNFPLLQKSTIRDNGYGIAVWDKSFNIDSCLLENNTEYAIGIGTNAKVTLTNSIVRSNGTDTSSTSGSGIRTVTASQAVGIDCYSTVFEGNYGSLVLQKYNVDMNFYNCTFVNNHASEGVVIMQGLCQHKEIVLEDCVVAFNQGNSMFYKIPGCSDDTLHIGFSCTNIFSNGGGDWTGQIAEQLATNGNISANPLFCDTASGDYRIKDSSPCAPANNSCGVLIGAYGIGCANVAPVVTSANSVQAVSGVRFVYKATSTDTDGPDTSYSFTNYPSWLTAIGDSAFGIPPLTEVDTSFMVIVSDGFLADSLIVAVEITESPIIGALTTEGVAIAMNVISHTPIFGWQYFDATGSYPQTQFEIAVGSDSDWTHAELWNPAPFAGAATSKQYAGAALEDGQTYWVRARVRNALIWSNWKQTSFRMNSVPGVPELRLPVDNSIVNTEHPTLVVRNPSDAENDSMLITFELSGDNFATSFVPIEVRAGSDSLTSLWVNFPLNEDQQFWWRVKVSDYFEESPYSPVRSFWINSVNSAPTAFSLVSPPNGSSPALPINVPEFTWQNSLDIDPGDSVEFTLQLAIDPSFSFMSQITGLTSPNYLPATPLEWGRRYWWRVKAQDQSTGVRWSNETFDFKIMALGDADGSGTVTISDVVFLINYIFGGGPAPNPIESGDADCSGAVTISDVVYLINYIFAGTAAPCEG